MATHKSIKIGIISFVLVAVALGLGLGLGAKREEGRAGSVQGSLAKEVDKLDSIGAIDCAGRRALIVPGVEDLVPGVEDYGTPGYVRRLATEATAPVEVSSDDVQSAAQCSSRLISVRPVRQAPQRRQVRLQESAAQSRQRK